MRIAVWHNFPSGGGKRALYDHVRGLLARGHELECWAPDTADRDFMPLSKIVPEHVFPSASNGMRRYRVGRKLARHYYEELSRLSACEGASRACAKTIDEGEFDILFASASASPFMPNIVRHLRTPKVLYLQEPSRYLYEASPELPWVATASENLDQAGLFGWRRLIHDYPRLQTLRLQAKQEWLNAQACDRLLVNSYFSRENVSRAYGVDAHVCYLGVDINVFRNLHMQRERFIVGIGAIQPRKRIDLAVRAIALLPEPRPTLIWIANAFDANYRTEVSALATALNVDLQFKETISDNELVETLNQASLMVYTSRLEPFGLAPLEANACGLPVVAVAEGGVRETIAHEVNGLLVDADPEAIAAGIDRLLNQPALARNMGESAAELARQKWSLDRAIDRLVTFLLAAARKAA